MKEVLCTRRMPHKNNEYYVTFNAYPEFKDIGNYTANKEDSSDIKDRLSRGDNTSWFTSELIVTLKETGITGKHTLGCCTCRCFINFTDSDKVSEMIDMATIDLEKNIMNFKNGPKTNC
jgi:hypothetical protein